ncbi:RabGAP/TBC [Schizophyllum commune Tattone D]|nr:RabGAP/TBC [Schizophyllum commune Tattone D]
MTNLSQSVASLTHSGPLKTPTPHPNEDPDAFHVRHTYALLDLCGVKGDGFVEGVERTRARVGSSRNSQMDAAQAIADVDEKKKDLDDKERAVLQALDRYGFYESGAHERLVKMPAAPLSQPLKMIAPATVDAGPAPSAFAAASKNNNAPPPPAPPSLSSLPPPQPLTKEVPRLEKWGRMVVPLTRDEGGNIETWGIREGVSEKKLKRRVYKGVPDRWRSATWVILVRRAVCKAGLGEGHPGFGGERQVEAEMKRLQAVYLEKLEQPSTYDIQIDLDVPRTIGGHVMFKTRYGFGQRALFHVLHSFSLYCDTCGYVQGMGPIASTLLLHLPPSTVYTLLCFMHSSPAYSLHSMFAPGFPGLLEAIYVQERIMQTTMPDVYAALRDKGVGTTAYATKWYITLFVTSLPFQTVLRLWDCWLLEGRDVWVILAAAVVRVFRDHIIAPGASFESILSLLSSFFVPEDEDALLTWMSKMLADTKLRQSMAEWRRTWAGLVKEGKDATALL